MAADSQSARESFQSYIEAYGEEGAVGELAVLLARGELTRGAADQRIGVRPADWLKPSLLGLLLFYIERVLPDPRFPVEEQSTVRELKLLLRVQEGDFLRFRRAEVSALLAEQLERMLEDHHIDDAEALRQVELQRAFDLSYDEYLALTQPAVEAAVARLLERSEDPRSGQEVRRRAHAQLEALRTGYLLGAAAHRRMGRYRY